MDGIIDTDADITIVVAEVFKSLAKLRQGTAQKVRVQDISAQ